MTRRALLILLALSLLAYIGCGGGSGVSPNAPRTPAPPANPGQPAAQSPPESRNTLSMQLPALGTVPAGAEFDCIISARFSDVLYQGSGRVAYDPAVVQPVSVKRGPAVPVASVFAAKLDAPQMPLGAGVRSVVPFAFTGLPGSAGCGKCDGELLRIRFKLLSPTAANPVGLVNEPEYLQLRGMQGQRLGFDLSTEVVSK